MIEFISAVASSARIEPVHPNVHPSVNRVSARAEQSARLVDARYKAVLARDRNDAARQLEDETAREDRADQARLVADQARYDLERRRAETQGDNQIAAARRDEESERALGRQADAARQDDEQAAAIDPQQQAAQQSPTVAQTAALALAARESAYRTEAITAPGIEAVTTAPTI